MDEEKIENRKGIYKNADLLKMHAYKDAIRRSGGAYVLYPGDKSFNQKGFHEIIPGLGAFPVRPSKTNDGVHELKEFILSVVDHFMNRTSQREKMAFRSYDVYKSPPDPGDELKEPLPEPINSNRNLIPDETFVLVGYYKSAEHYLWIINKQLYNTRTGRANGSVSIDNQMVNARYLLLHTSGDQDSGELWRITGGGPKLYSKKDLLDLKYPDPRQDFYLVYQVEKVIEPEFDNMRWQFRNLKKYSSKRSESPRPFAVSLSELIKVRVR